MFSQKFSTDHGIYYNHLRKSHGKGGGVGRGSVYPPRVGSMNSYLFSRVASQVGFSNILELRFQKVKIRIFLSNCWTWTYFFLDFLFVLHNCTPSTHLTAVFYNIPHRWIELLVWADWLIWNSYSNLY